MADGFVADSGIRAQLSSLESSVSGLASVIPTQEMGRFTDYLFELQRQTGMTNSEIEQYRQSLEKLSRITKTYSQRDLAQVNAELRKNTVAFRMLGRETESYIKMLSTAFPTGANKANQSILSLQKNIPELFTLMKAGQRDVATLFEIMQTGGEEALSTYMAIIDATGDRRQLDAINKLSIAWNEYSKNVEDLELRISSVAAETVLAFSESAKGVSSIGAAAGVAIKQVTKLGGAMTNLISTAAMLQMSGLVNIGGLRGAISGGGGGGAIGLSGRLGAIGMRRQMAGKMGGNLLMSGAGRLGQGAGLLKAGLGSAAFYGTGIFGGGMIGDMGGRYIGEKLDLGYETSVGAAWDAAKSLLGFKSGGIRMKGSKESAVTSMGLGQLQEKDLEITKQLTDLNKKMIGLTVTESKPIQEDINKLLEKQGQYRTELIKKVEVEFATNNRQKEIYNAQNDYLSAQVDYIIETGIGLDKVDDKVNKILDNRIKTLQKDESILKNLIKQETNVDKIKSLNERLASIEKEKLQIFNLAVSSAEKMISAREKEFNITKSILEMRKQFIEFEGESTENSQELYEIRQKNLEMEIQLAKMRVKELADADKKRNLFGSENRDKLNAIKKEREESEKTYATLINYTEKIDIKKATSANLKQRLQELGAEYAETGSSSYGKVIEGRRESIKQYLKLTKQIEGGALTSLPKDISRLKEQESFLQKAVKMDEERSSIARKQAEQNLKNLMFEYNVLAPKKQAVKVGEDSLKELQIEGDYLKANLELENQRFKNIDDVIEKEKYLLSNYKAQNEQLKDNLKVAKQFKNLPEQRRIQTQMTGMQQQIQGQELKIALAPIVQREKELNVLNAILDSSKSIVDSFKAPVEYIANYTRQQVSISQENMKLQEQKLTEMMKQEGVNQNDLLEQVSKVREAGAKTASLMDQYKRTWEEKFTQFTLGMSTGTYIYKADTSRMAKLGPAFQPWRNTDRGLGTREAIMEGLGMGGRERTKVEIEIAKQLARIAAAFEDQGFKF